MGLEQGTCDDCGEPAAYLFPLAVLDTLPSGGKALITKWYCVSCWGDAQDQAESNAPEERNEEEDEEEPPSNRTIFDMIPKCPYPGDNSVKKK